MMTPPAATVRRADEVPFTTIAVGTDAAVQVLVGPAQGDTGYVTRRFRMGSGGGMPLHTNLVEHQQYVLCGRARITIGREVHEVGADSYEVLDGPFEFLCIVPDRPDQIALLEQC
jgi:quercetin dioxygenase-like cupin family protein